MLSEGATKFDPPDMTNTSTLTTQADRDHGPVRADGAVPGRPADVDVPGADEPGRVAGHLPGRPRRGHRHRAEHLHHRPEHGRRRPAQDGRQGQPDARPDDETAGRHDGPLRLRAALGVAADRARPDAGLRAGVRAADAVRADHVADGEAAPDVGAGHPGRPTTTRTVVPWSRSAVWPAPTRPGTARSSPGCPHGCWTRPAAERTADAGQRGVRAQQHVRVHRRRSRVYVLAMFFYLAEQAFGNAPCRAERQAGNWSRAGGTSIVTASDQDTRRAAARPAPAATGRRPSGWAGWASR